jgi:hypothetical protein
VFYSLLAAGTNYRDPLAAAFGVACVLIASTLLYGFVGWIRWLAFWRPADAAKKALRQK